MKPKKTIFIITLLLIVSNILSAQTQSDSQSELASIGKTYAYTKSEKYQEAKGSQNEIEWLFSGLFLAYKNFFSSQDGASCSFTPSCSEFGILAIRKYGPIQGMFLTFDRLTRCNRLSPHKYEMEEESTLFIDHP